ncbi:MAG: thioesterase family protein [Solirubrobacteraceae bacterium]|nr:thioesterase family protein [Patulibacter sp.]
MAPASSDSPAPQDGTAPHATPAPATHAAPAPQDGTASHATPAPAPQDGTAPHAEPAPAPHATPGAFALATAVEPRGDGRYGCVFDADWAALAGINGGIIMAILIRAIEAEVDPDRRIRSLQCQFLRPPKARAAEIVIETTRTGARATNLRVRVEQEGKLIVDALATCFTGGLREVGRWSPSLPAEATKAPSNQHISDPRLPAIADRVQYTPAIGPFPMSGTPLEPGAAARTGGWIELREPHPVDTSLLAFFLDAWWPAALGPIDVLSFNPTIDMTFDLRTALPSEGLPHQALFVDFATQASLEGLVDEDARIFSADGQLLAQARQLAITLTAEDRPPVTKSSHASID